MAVDYFISVLRERYSALSASDRKQKIRELVADSHEQADFIQKNFSEFFAEAFPSENSMQTTSARAKSTKKNNNAHRRPPNKNSGRPATRVRP